MRLLVSLCLSLPVRLSVCPSVNTLGIRCNVKIVCVCTVCSTGKICANTATAHLTMSSQTLAGIKLRAYIVFIVLFALLLLLLLLFHLYVERTDVAKNDWTYTYIYSLCTPPWRAQ
jgi:hypothetical protein